MDSWCITDVYISVSKSLPLWFCGLGSHIETVTLCNITCPCALIGHYEGPALGMALTHVNSFIDAEDWQQASVMLIGRPAAVVFRCYRGIWHTFILCPKRKSRIQSGKRYIWTMKILKKTEEINIVINSCYLWEIPGRISFHFISLHCIAFFMNVNM